MKTIQQRKPMPKLFQEKRKEEACALGRSRGYSYAKDGSTQQTVSTGYAVDGRVQRAGFLHGGTERNFEYGYLANSHLLHSLSMPNGMSLVQSYETQRDLLTSMAYHRGATLVSQRDYLYDALGRPTSRTTARQGTTKQDSFAYDTRSQLTAATVDNGNYAYGYDKTADGCKAVWTNCEARLPRRGEGQSVAMRLPRINIGNRKTAQELAEEIDYTANQLNQYSSIVKDSGTPFIPSFDASGNQTLVQTSTGIWAVEYNAENRPITFTQGDTLIECAYDYMGRRATKKVTTNGTTTLHHRYIYRGYLQIACCDLLRSAHPCLWLITWEPLHGGIVSQPTATRPLAIQKDGTYYTYGWDLTKNICEAFNTSGGIAAAYTYSPFGAVSKTGSITQPIQWSSEFADEELGLVYYNFRHYNALDGRWINRDPVGIHGGLNLYGFVGNGIGVDSLGLRKLTKEEESIVKMLINSAKGTEFEDQINKVVNTYKDHIFKDNDSLSEHKIVHQALRRFALPTNDEMRAYLDLEIRAKEGWGSTQYQCSRYVKAVIKSALDINIKQEGVTASSFIHTIPRKFQDFTFDYSTKEIEISYGEILAGSASQKIGTNEAHIVVSLGHGLSIGHHSGSISNEISRSVKCKNNKGQYLTAKYEITIRETSRVSGRDYIRRLYNIRKK